MTSSVTADTVLFAMNNPSSRSILEDVYLHVFPNSHIRQCKVEDTFQTYKMLCADGERPHLLITDDLSFGTVEKIQNFDAVARCVWIVKAGTANSILVEGIHHGMTDFLRWPASKEEIEQLFNELR